MAKSALLIATLCALLAVFVAADQPKKIVEHHGGYTIVTYEKPNITKQERSFVGMETIIVDPSHEAYGVTPTTCRGCDRYWECPSCVVKQTFWYNPAKSYCAMNGMRTTAGTEHLCIVVKDEKEGWQMHFSSDDPFFMCSVRCMYW